MPPTEPEHILDTQALRARQTLEAHRDTLDAVAAALLTQETLLGDELADLVATAEADTGTAPTRLAG